MSDRENLKRILRMGTAASLMFAMGAVHGNVLAAQDTDVEELDEEPEEIVVTGSRIKRKEFTSASPIQIIDGERSREIGLIDPAEILQTSNQATGFQFDNTFTQFVLDNGPGSSTVSFRALGADRTLVLVNGRRLAPAGAGGAPSAADLNLIPALAIDSVENLLDGASTVYGSDAIAGVSNILLRREVDGLELSGNASLPFQSGGESFSAGVIWGKTFDKGFFNISGEINDRSVVRYADREWTADCDRYFYEGDDGNIYDEYRGLAPGTSNRGCKLDTYNRVFIDTGNIAGNLYGGNIWRTPGFTNIEVPNFSETVTSTFWTNPAGVWQIPGWTDVDTNGDGIPDSALVDPDGDGLSDVDLQDPYWNYALSDEYLGKDFLTGLRRYSMFGSGEYMLDEDSNTRFFFEGLWSRRDQTVRNNTFGFFPLVPGSNPTNPCNFNSPLGVDCALALNDSFIFNALGFGGFPFPTLLFGEGPPDVTPIVYIRGDRDETEVQVSQFRMVGGVAGDFSLRSREWSWEASLSYSKSTGRSSNQGVREDRLNLSLNTTRFDGDGNLVCGDGTDGCVVVNLFADSIFQEGGGTFETQAERDWLFDSSEFLTTVEQWTFNAFATGEVFDLPWNGEAVPMVVGVEYRDDSVNSLPNEVAEQGLLAFRNADRGAQGSRSIKEVFGEISFPLARGLEMAEELTIDVSGRVTDESFSRTAGTYSFKGLYRPTEWLTFRGTYGTSFRAPNLRERFLLGTTGFNTVSDPCAVPSDARVRSDPNDFTSPIVYDPSEDQRNPRVLAACAADGVDPTTLGLDGYGPLVSAEVNSRGDQEIGDETSTAKTWGFVIEQPFTDKIDMRFSATWFDIQINNSLTEPTGFFILNQCYNNISQPEGNPAFCARIERDENGQLLLLDRGFLNIASRTSKGIDFNFLYEQDFEIADETLSVSLDVTATNMKEQFTQVNELDPGNDSVGDPELPKWQGRANLRMVYRKLAFNWLARYIQGGENVPSAFDPDAPPCDGLPVSCRPIYFTTDYDVHNASITWNEESWSATLGVRNVFDTLPPRIDTDGVFGYNNFALGAGYDLMGRTAFLNFAKKF